MNSSKLNRAIKATRGFQIHQIETGETSRKLPEGLVNEIYDILVEECGAPDEWREVKAGPNKGEKYNSHRGSFVQEFSENDNPTREWRFYGDLGFGGKFWWNGKFYVNCYSEDSTPVIDKMIDKANERLLVLFEKYVDNLIDKK
jgi:hypothetical protein